MISPSRDRPTGILHFIPSEEQCLVARVAGRFAHDLAGNRRDVDLRLEAGRQHLGRLGDLSGQHSVLDQEDVAVEAGPFVPGAKVGNHPVNADGLAASREFSLKDEYVVELEEAALTDRHPELEGRGRIGPDHPADGRGIGLFAHYSATKLSQRPRTGINAGPGPRFKVPWVRVPGQPVRSPYQRYPSLV